MSGGNARVYCQLFAGMAIFGSATPISKIVTDGFPLYVAAGLRMAVFGGVLRVAWSHAKGLDSS